MTTRINTLKINAPEINERRWRLLRFGAELSRRGMRFRMLRPPNGRWRLRVLRVRRSGATGAATGGIKGGITVFCAGTEGTYVLVTAEGRILACADRSGARRAADLLTTFPALRVHPTQERCTS